MRVIITPKCTSKSMKASKLQLNYCHIKVDDMSCISTHQRSLATDSVCEQVLSLSRSAKHLALCGQRGVGRGVWGGEWLG